MELLIAGFVTEQLSHKDEAAYGHYHTKDTILEIYDAMAESMRTGQPYPTRLDPPPADPKCCHPPRDVALGNLFA